MAPISGPRGGRIAGSQAGASLITVLIAASVLSISVAAAAVAMKQMLFARRTSESSQAANEIGATVAAGALGAFQTYVNASCAGAAGSINTINVGSAVGTLTKTKKIALPTPFGSLTYPPEAAAAVNRCATTAAKRSAPGATNAYLFDCYLFTPSATASAIAGKDTFAAAGTIGNVQYGYAFAEIYVQVRDFQTDAPMGCATAAGGQPGRGLSLYYALHWSTKTSDGWLYKTRVGVADASF